MAQAPIAAVRLAALETENAKLTTELAALRAKVFTNGDRAMTMEGRTFTVESNGFILDNNFDFDAGLQVSGDFVGKEKAQYAQMIADALNKPNAMCTHLTYNSGEDMNETYDKHGNLVQEEQIYIDDPYELFDFSESDVHKVADTIIFWGAVSILILIVALVFEEHYCLPLVIASPPPGSTYAQ